MATLYIAKFKKDDTYQVNGKTILKSTFPNGEEDIKCYELKDTFYKENCLMLNKEEVYWCEPRFEDLLLNDKHRYTKDNIKRSFSLYCDDIYGKHRVTEDKINHLRNALVANMIGVIGFLQKKYPGFIILEDLNKNLINKHF